MNWSTFIFSSVYSFHEPTSHNMTLHSSICDHWVTGLLLERINLQVILFPFKNLHCQCHFACVVSVACYLADTWMFRLMFWPQTIYTTANYPSVIKVLPCSMACLFCCLPHTGLTKPENLHSILCTTPMNHWWCYVLFWSHFYCYFIKVTISNFL